jgi:hypothetical protein
MATLQTTTLMMNPCKPLIINTIVDLENVQRNKKKEKGEVTGHQVSSNYMSKSLYIKNRLPVIGQLYFSMSKVDCFQ